MRRLISALLALALVALSTAPSEAIELRNHDQRAYTVVVRSRHSRKTLELPARSASLVVCVGSCSFRVRGVGAVRARDNQVVTIEDRRIRRTR